MTVYAKCLACGQTWIANRSHICHRMSLSRAICLHCDEIFESREGHTCEPERAAEIDWLTAQFDSEWAEYHKSAEGKHAEEYAVSERWFREFLRKRKTGS